MFYFREKGRVGCYSMQTDFLMLTLSIIFALRNKRN